MTGGYHPFASSIPGQACASTLAPEAGAQCARRARWDLRGGRPATAVPTAIRPFVDDGLRARACSVAAPATCPGVPRARIGRCRLPAASPRVQRLEEDEVRSVGRAIGLDVHRDFCEV